MRMAKGIGGKRGTDRLSTCSCRSATLFSMRKMSISSAEKERASVLRIGEGVSFKNWNVELGEPEVRRTIAVGGHLASSRGRDLGLSC